MLVESVHLLTCATHLSDHEAPFSPLLLDQGQQGSFFSLLFSSVVLYNFIVSLPLAPPVQPLLVLIQIT